jgi:hypothetical protein
MSTNWIVPSANPNTPNNVDQLVGGTPNVTIGGTSSIPSVGVSQGGVLSVETVTGNVNLNPAGGMTIVGSGTDVTLTAPVRSVVGGTNCTIVQNPAGTYVISFT